MTLRRERMYEFLDRLITIALPRVRDFRGINGKSLTVAVTTTWVCVEQIIFPNRVRQSTLRGMNITITTTAKTDEEARALLAAFVPVQGLITWQNSH